MGEAVMGVLLAIQPVSKFTLSFCVPGPVVGKGRAKFGYGRAYTPARTLNYEGLVRHEAALAMRGRPLIEAAVRLLATIYVQVPASYSKRKRADCFAGLVWPISRPDWDNFGKLVSDACNGIVFRDDAQVVDGRVLKVWAVAPSLSVVVEAL
jgi:Holliday junction resolvase RusA-like endonuclease